MDLPYERLVNIYQSVSGPVLRSACKELFASRGMRDSKAEIASDQLYQKLLDTGENVFDCAQLVSQMKFGVAVNIDSMIADVKAGKIIRWVLFKK